jgi:hypothetical protein
MCLAFLTMTVFYSAIFDVFLPLLQHGKLNLRLQNLQDVLDCSTVGLDIFLPSMSEA